MPIDPVTSSLARAALSGAAPAAAVSPAPANATTPANSFGDALHDLLASVNGADASANQAVGNMLDGTGDVHEAMIALQRADTMLELTVQIRNKVVDAYQDIMRMPV
jgi:flagellar hook-basal body complex protein FliE